MQVSSAFKSTGTVSTVSRPTILRCCSATPELKMSMPSTGKRLNSTVPAGYIVHGPNNVRV
jgi:hypothetical protein